MQNNMFLKVITIFITVTFVFGMVPLEALAGLCEGPSAMRSWNKCQWAIEPKGQELTVPSTKEISFPNSQEAEYCNADSQGQTYTMQFPTISWSRGGHSWPNFINSSDTNFQQWVSIAPVTSFSQEKTGDTTAAYYKLKTDSRGRISNKANQALYEGKNSCCPDGKSYSDKCKTGTTKTCLVAYCQSNPTDCTSYQVATPAYQYRKIVTEGPKTLHSSKITKLPEVNDEQKAICSPIFEAYKIASESQKNGLREQLFSNGCGLEAEHTVRTVPKTITNTVGEIVACGTKGTWLNRESRTCPNGGESIDGNSSIVLADGTTKPIKQGVESGWSDYKFIPSGQPIITQIPEYSLTCQNIANTVSLAGWHLESCNPSVCGSNPYVECQEKGKQTLQCGIWKIFDKTKYNEQCIERAEICEITSTYQTSYSSNPSCNNLLDKELSRTERPLTDVSSKVQVVTPDEIVASVTWQASGKDCDGGVPEECVKYGGARGVYLTADGTVFDGHVYKNITYGGGFLGVLGFLVGWAVNIIIPGSGFIIWGAVTWGDVIFIGSLLLPGGSTSFTLPSGLSMVNCNVTSLPLEVSQPTISAQPNCDAQNAVSVTLSLIPDSTKTGLVIGYELYRQKEGETTQTLVKKQEDLNMEQSQSTIIYVDASGLQKYQNYLYLVWPIVASGTRTSAIATVKTICSSTCTFSASPSTIIKPAKSTLSWSCTNANNCNITPEVGNVFQSGNASVQPNQTTTYILTCNNGQISKTAKVTVLKPGYCEINPSGDGCE